MTDAALTLVLYGHRPSTGVEIIQLENAHDWLVA
jgi:hypothetical protein